MKPDLLTCRTFKYFNIESFLLDLDFSLSTLLPIDNIEKFDLETVWQLFKLIFILTCDTYAPVRNYKTKGSAKPWISGDIIELMKHLDKLYKKAIKQGSSETLSNYKIARNKVNSLILSAKRDYFKTHISGSNSDHRNPTSLWHTLKEFIGDKKSKTSISDKIKPDELNHHFANVGRKLTEPMKIKDPIWKGPSSVYDFIFYEINETSVARELDALGNKSNSDLLGFDSKLLRLSSCIIAKYITFFINKSISTAHVLLDWKKARVTALYKGKGSQNDCNSYRPISVLCHIAKIMEKCVHSQIIVYLEQHNFLTPNQSAYLKNHSTQTALINVTNNWYQNIEDGLITGICFFDISKCFDALSHEIIFFKIEKYGIRNHALNWFRSYLTNRSQAISSKNSMTQFINITTGVFPPLRVNFRSNIVSYFY